MVADLLSSYSNIKFPWLTCLLVYHSLFWYNATTLPNHTSSQSNHKRLTMSRTDCLFGHSISMIGCSFGRRSRAISQSHNSRVSLRVSWYDLGWCPNFSKIVRIVSKSDTDTSRSCVPCISMVLENCLYVNVVRCHSSRRRKNSCSVYVLFLSYNNLLNVLRGYTHSALWDTNWVRIVSGWIPYNLISYSVFCDITQSIKNKTYIYQKYILIYSVIARYHETKKI